jgi:adenine-specific DNA-methyltransferase
MVRVAFTHPYKRLKNLKTYIMSTEQKVTNDIRVPNKDLEALKNHFPQCFDKDGNFQLEKFKDNLTTKEINFSTESYGLDWLGKSYARLLASDPATTLLKADEIHNTKPENVASENILIKGDNLEVLKHLSHAYYEKVKMIYIDPPYNTGSDGFVYQDDRKFTAKELVELAGIDVEKARRILDFTRSNSNSHSAWLTFMYPRLYIAKQLLREDGVIFISIDDNEVAQLRMVMDEIFGEENFVGNIVWNNVTDNNPTNIATEHEYILCYSRNKQMLNSFWKSDISEIKDLLVNVGNEFVNKYEDQQELQTTYSKWFKEYKNQLGELDRYKFIDQGGIYTGSQSVHNPGKEGYRYDIIHPITGKPCKQPLMGYRFPKTTMDKMIEEGRIIFGDEDDKLIEIKVYAKDYLQKLSSILKLDGRTGANELKDLFPTVKKVFTNPKTVKLLEELISFATDKNDLVLDYFAGSGTTADAIMQLNAADRGNRKFILVQLPEVIDYKKSKDAYDFVKEELGAEPTIFEITKERLIRAARKINAQLDEKSNNIALKIKNLEGEIQTEETIIEIQNLKDQIIQNETLKAQNAFQIYETTPIWEDYNLDAEELNHQISLFDESKLTADDIQVLQTTWKTYDGIPLTQALTAIDLGGYHAQYGSGKLYLLDKGFTTDHLKTLLEKIDSDKNFNPTSIITFGYHFDSKNLRELSENVKSYANKKNIDIDFITRY